MVRRARIDSGTEDNPNSVEADEVSGEVYARNFDGSTLGERIDNALASLPNGQGRVRVTSKSDGSAWKWSTWTIDPTNYNGVDIDIDSTVDLEYVDEGWAITVKSGNGNNLEKFTLTGGNWSASGANPSGWLRQIDTIESTIVPHTVSDGWTNSDVDCTAIKFENHQHWNEMNYVGGISIQADRGIDMVPASESDNSFGTGGTESLHGNKINVGAISCNDYGIRFSGKAQYIRVDGTQVFCGADGADAFHLDADRMDGTHITGGWKAENPEQNADNAAFRLGTDYDGFYAPYIDSGFIGFDVESDVRDEGAVNADVYHVNAHGTGGVTVRELVRGTEIEFTRNGGIVCRGGGVSVSPSADSAAISMNGNEVIETSFGIVIAKSKSDNTRFELKDTGLELKDQTTDTRRMVLGQDGAVKIDQQDLTAGGAPAPSERGVGAVHDGTGAAPAGRYESDPDNSQWSGVGLTSGNTISY